jgi:hypothetical protein
VRLQIPFIERFLSSVGVSTIGELITKIRQLEVALYWNEPTDKHELERRLVEAAASQNHESDHTPDSVVLIVYCSVCGQEFQVTVVSDGPDSDSSTYLGAPPYCACIAVDREIGGLSHSIIRDIR